MAAWCIDSCPHKARTVLLLLLAVRYGSTLQCTEYRYYYGSTFGTKPSTGNAVQQYTRQQHNTNSAVRYSITKVKHDTEGECICLWVFRTGFILRKCKQHGSFGERCCAAVSYRALSQIKTKKPKKRSSAQSTRPAGTSTWFVIAGKALLGFLHAPVLHLFAAVQYILRI